jgi:hexosaminidase
MEPPKGYPRGSNRDFDAYTPLNRLADVIPPESDAARQFREIASRIVAGNASPADWLRARQWLTLWRDNDAVMQPLLSKSALTAELEPLSRNLGEAAAIGLSALDELEQHTPVPSSLQQKRLAALKRLGASMVELTDMVVPGVETIVLATRP